jgi:hypothetical protein
VYEDRRPKTPVRQSFNCVNVVLPSSPEAIEILAHAQSLPSPAAKSRTVTRQDKQASVTATVPTGLIPGQPIEIAMSVRALSLEVPRVSVHLVHSAGMDRKQYGSKDTAYQAACLPADVAKAETSPWLRAISDRFVVAKYDERVLRARSYLCILARHLNKVKHSNYHRL